MKAHGITLGGGTGVKKETKDSKEGVKGRATKKRKLAAVDEDAGDVDEPVKTEVKGEVKTEDLIGVKAEQQENGGVATATIPSAIPAASNGFEPTAQPTTTSPPTNAAANDEDDDDEVQVISATERRDDSGGNGASVYGSISGHHHSHSHSHSHSPAPMIPGIHSFDYAANMGYPQTQSTTSRMSTTPTATMATSNALPYGFPAAPWMFHHDSHGFL